MIGTQISHYRILEKLGAGGMGVVYKAEDTKLGRKVALKFLPHHLAASSEEKARFIQEARAASALDHPNICTIYEINETDEGQIYLAMACYEGETLQQKIAQSRLDVAEALKIAAQIAGGLAKAHDRSIIHRDIKPANIMLTRDGLAKILDFGLAKLAGHSRITKTGSTLGTVAYMSPEQTRGEDVDHRADIWSLGIILYEMLSGVLPFKGEYEVALLYSINNEEPIPIEQFRADVPAPVSAIIMSCLRKNPDQRYQSMAQLLQDLQALLDGHKISTSALPANNRSKKRFRYLAGTLLIILSLVSAWLTFRKPSDSGVLDSQSLAVMPFTYRGAPEYKYLAEGMVDLLSTSLDGAGKLRNVDPRAILVQIKALQNQEVDAAQANVIARRFSAGLFLLGAIVEIRGQLRISATLYRTNALGQAYHQLAVDGKDDTFLHMVDQISREILTKQYGKPAQQLESIGTTTTKSIPALKAYLEAVQAERNGHIAEEYQLLQQAVQLDSTFAMAWYYLSAYAIGWAANIAEARDAIAKAKKYGANLNERYRMYIDAMDYWIKGENQAAHEMDRRLVNKYSDDLTGWFWLAGDFTVNLYGQSALDNLSNWHRLIALDPNNANVYQQMLPWTIRLRHLSDIDETIEKMLELSPDHEYAWMYMVPRAFIAADKAAQAKTIEESRTKQDMAINITAWNIAQSANDPESAAPFYRILTAPNQPLPTRLCGYHSLALLKAGKGKKQECMAILDTVAALQPAAGLIFRAYLTSLPFLKFSNQELEKIKTELKAWRAENEINHPASEFVQSMPVYIYPQTRLYLLGLVHAALGEMEQVEQKAVELEKMPTPYDQSSIVEHWGITLRILRLMHMGDYTEALAMFEKSTLRIRFCLYNTVFYSFAFQRYLRGELLSRLNRPLEAIPWFRSIDEMFWQDIPFRAMARLRTAEIYESMKQESQARKYYQIFIDTWQDSDSELQPDVSRIRKQIN